MRTAKSRVKQIYPLQYGKGIQVAVARVPLFEAHITASKGVDSEGIIEEIKKLKIPFGVDFFIKVSSTDQKGHLIDIAHSFGATGMACSTPTGHDLEYPGLMITFRADEYLEIADNIRKVLAIVAKTGKPHNFEVEKMLRDRRSSLLRINVKRDFPGYVAIDPRKRPLHENHIGWHDEEGKLPTHEKIVEDLARTTGIIPHQIVDFALTEGGQVVDTVVSYYQRRSENLLSFAPILREAARELKATYTLKEQVCVVGVPIK